MTALVTVMLSFVYADCYKQAHYAECLCAKCLYAECHYVECHGTLCGIIHLRKIHFLLHSEI